jgi:hypothetical protein
MMKYSHILRVLFVVTFLLILFVLYKVFWFGTLNITSIGQYETVVIDGKSYDSRLIESMELRPGNHVVSAFGPTQRPYEQTVSIGAFKNSGIELPGQAISEEALSQHITSGNVPPDFSIYSFELFDNNFWSVVFVGPSDGNGEGWSDIYQFDGRRWVLVESGTGYDSSYLIAQGYPESVVNYMESASE